MPQIWKEAYVAGRHFNPMSVIPADTSPDPAIIPRWVYFVRVCDFTFEFHSIAQLQACLAYYAQKLHPSSRLPVYTHNYGGDHMETQRWFERLPLYLREEPKRQRVVKALQQALDAYANNRISTRTHAN